MNNKILKSLVLLSVITIIFFIKIDNVKADAQASGCNYYVPMPFISSDGKAALFKLSIENKSNEDKSFLGYFFSGGAFGTRNATASKTNTYDITGLCVKNNILYIATNMYSTADGENKISDELWEYFEMSTPVVATSRYYKVDAKSGVFTPATEADYKRYLASLSGKLKGDANRLFVSKDIGKVSYNCISSDACVIADPNYVILNEVIGSYIVFAYGGDIISPDKSTQKLTSTLEPYPNEEWGYFDLMCSEANKDGNYDCDKAKQGLEKVIDTGDVDRRTFTKAYYTATKDPWANFMKTTNDKAMQEKTGTFRYWFDNVGRYAYEDRNSAPFKTYWNYICDNKAYSVTEEECESVNGFLEGKTDFKNYTNYKKDLENDPCMAAFAPNCLKGSSTVQYNGTACDAQRKAGAYKTCKSCVDKSKTKGDTTTQQAYQEQCMGANDYAKFKEAYSNQMDEYDEQIKNAAKNGINSALSLYNLRVANAPTLNVTFGGKYQVDCDDFKVLKIIYDIMVIIAPVMLIVFGSIDYAKAVMASDVEKMRKAQKKFIPRVIAAVLLFIIPVAIRLIISFAGLEDTALTCIIK